MVTHQKNRCFWVNDDPLYIDYHDYEWGVPIHDEKLLFEFLILEGMQAGLSWITILKKRENYRACLNNFNPQKIVRYDQSKINELLTNPGIIRNRLKIQSIITNAEAYLKLKEEQGSFSDYIWSFVDGEPIKNHWKDHKQLPATSAVSDALSKDLKKRGFKFIGSTICYAFMQAVGMVNDHLTTCFRYKEIS
ncbi:MAG: DNA-3-methyladenine glycosylase I [Proteobacteria bacterium]|nr:DNA-3-methyladenine glycosylase I [Pseudomonadota bacterium]